MSSIYKTHGPLLDEQSHLYVARSEDLQTAADVRRGRCVILLGARRTGKTSLLLRLRRSLIEEGHFPVYVDVPLIGAQDEEAWYRHLGGQLDAQLGEAIGSADTVRIWDQIGFRQALRQFAHDLDPSKRIVILLDEPTALPSDVLVDHLSTIRAILNERTVSSELRQCTFVIGGTFLTDDLVRNAEASPFEVASRVYTSDAAHDGIDKLVRILESTGHVISEEVTDEIIGWTGGHLYWTQRICSVLEKSEEVCITREVVEGAVKQVLSDEDIERTCNSLPEWSEGKRVLSRVLLGSRPLRFSRASRVLAVLELMGLIASDEAGYCVVRNEICREALQDRWTEREAGGTVGGRCRCSAIEPQSSSKLNVPTDCQTVCSTAPSQG